MGSQNYPQYKATCGRCGESFSSPEPIDNVFCPGCPKGGMRGVLTHDEVDYGPEGDPSIDGTEEVIDSGFKAAKLSPQETSELSEFCKRYHEAHGTNNGSTALYWHLIAIIGRHTREGNPNEDISDR